MDNRNNATETLLDNPSDHYHAYQEYDTSIHISPAVVRQNIAEEARINFNLSFKFNILTFLIAIAKVIATLVVLSNVGNLCFGPRQVWLSFMFFYDLFHACLMIMNIQNIFHMRQLLARHQMTLSYNLNHPDAPIEPEDPSLEHSFSDLDHDEIREYDVEQDHRSSRIAGMSSSSARKHRTIKKMQKISDNLYFLIFMVGQIIFFLGERSPCDTTATNQLIIAYIAMGYVWLLTPLFILLLGCLCLPLLLIVLYFFARGNQIPASKINIDKLHITTYTKDTPGNKECVICMLDYHEGDKIVQLECSHMHHFHEACLKRWLKINGQCPVCRARIDEMAGTTAQSVQRLDTKEQTEAIQENENI